MQALTVWHEVDGGRFAVGKATVDDDGTLTATLNAIPLDGKITVSGVRAPKPRPLGEILNDGL